jgi:hypothetical protein
LRVSIDGAQFLELTQLRDELLVHAGREIPLTPIGGKVFEWEDCDRTNRYRGIVLSQLERRVATVFGARLEDTGAGHEHHQPSHDPDGNDQKREPWDQPVGCASLCSLDPPTGDIEDPRQYHGRQEAQSDDYHEDPESELAHTECGENDLRQL